LVAQSPRSLVWNVSDQWALGDVGAITTILAFVCSGVSIAERAGESASTTNTATEFGRAVERLAENERVVSVPVKWTLPTF
jgi:hypothetical protein